MRKFIKAIRENKILAFLVDQNTIRERGIFVDFFNLPAITVTFPAKLAVKHNKPVVFAYSIFDEKDKTYKCYVSQIEYEKTKKEYDDICALTKAYTKKIEEIVRKHPEQYLWTHKRWKTRPEGEPPVY